MENYKENISIGEYLHTIRKKKNLSLEEISGITKLNVRLLENIENNLFDDLGGIGYAKAMILTYAKALEISKDEVHELLQNQFNSKPQYISKSSSSQPKKYLIPTKIFSIMLLIIVILFLSYLVINLYKDGILTWPPFKKANAGMQIKPKEKTKKPIENTSKRNVPEVEKEDELVVLEQIEKPEVIVINDTIDHLDELLFKDKKNPFNYDE
ncbi:MAG: helix-turn-helix domain-containing protein [Candidatus Cloacimonetes bacterium]|jgi:cytoskeletal protein RodZ|nr:helix-turn-helix domain-containing protein [Candidatus Cloacimonadota bacterium]